MFKGSSDKKISCISEIWYHSLIYHAARRIAEILYSAIHGHLKLITGIMCVVSVRLLAKLSDNEFSWNHDRTYLLQVMVGIFFVVQDHTKGTCAKWDICQKRILNSNHAKSRLPIVYFISAQSFWNVHCTAVILTWSVQNIKNMCKLKGMLLTNEILRVLSLRWVSDGYPPTLDSPIGARFFQLYHVTRLKLGATEICARGVFFLSLLQSNTKSCTIC